MTQQRRAIVMGATSGIGREVALLLARKGWKVGIAGRREHLLCTLADTSDSISTFSVIDVTDENAPDKLEALINQLGGMDLYFHSSGIGWQNNGLDVAKELRTVETNCLGFTRMVTAAYNYFAHHGGDHIAVISSIAGTKGLGAAPAYSATKRFQNHYIECLAQQAHLRRLPIHLTDIRPGFVTTDLIKDSSYPLQLSPEKVAKSIVRAIEKQKSIVTIDWKYRILVTLWRLIPRPLWIRLPISTK